MDVLDTIIRILLTALGSLSVLISLPLFFRFRWPAPLMWSLKLIGSALSPFFILFGFYTTLVGLLSGSAFVPFLGAIIMLIYGFHYVLVTRPPSKSTGFGQAFGPSLMNDLYRKLRKYPLTGRTVFRLPDVPPATLEQNIVYATIPGTDRKLLCDIWLPPPGFIQSGLVFIYVHGSAFYILDKDFRTRTFFNQLAARGHVVMDIAYRLAPETDLMGMVNDVKRAIDWIKGSARKYGIDPNRVVLGGGSAGGHLALLAAYTGENSRFTPVELEGKDLTVCGVVSLYGTSDLAALYFHTNQHLTTRSNDRPQKAVPPKMPGWMIKSLGKDYYRLGFHKDLKNVGALAPLLGGHPEEYSRRYALFSPISHVDSNCPPTLLVHGSHDIMAPVKATCSLYERLLQNHVPTVMHILPQTDHGFDLLVPDYSPAAHTAINDVEYFLEIMSLYNRNPESSSGIRKTNQARAENELL